MPTLYEIPDDTWVDPEDAKDSAVLKNARKKWKKSVFKQAIDTIDAAIKDIVASGQNEFVWMDAGAVVGSPHGSEKQQDRIRDLWEAVAGLVGHDSFDPIATKIVRKTVGAMIRWRTSLRDEKYWLVTYQPIGKMDPVTNDEIHASRYWINPTYKPPKNSGFSLDELKGKYSGRSETNVGKAVEKGKKKVRR